jgi:putative membrane protein
MIRDYTNIAANERTFLAWVRTGIAIIALGFVIERFNLFLLAMATEAGATTSIPGFHRLSSPGGRYGAMALVGAGVFLIVVATIRFVHTARLLEDEAAHRPQRTHASLVLLSSVVLTVAAFSAYLAIG